MLFKTVLHRLCNGIWHTERYEVDKSGSCVLTYELMRIRNTMCCLNTCAYTKLKFDSKNIVVSWFTYFNANIELRILNRLYT